MLKNFLKFYSEKFSEFLKADGWLVLLLIVLNLTPILRTFTFWGMMLFKDNFLYELKTVYLGAVIILAICLIIHFTLSKLPRLKFFLQIALLIGFAISFVLDVFTIYTFKLILMEHFIDIALETNPNEAKEFLNSYVLNLKTFSALIAFSVLLTAAIKKFRKIFKNLSAEKLQRISYHTLIFLMPVVVTVFFYVGNFIFTAAYQNTILARNIKSTYNAIKNAENEPEIFATMDSQNEKIISDNSKVPYVVFILGESETRNHMQLYGYYLENTPLAVKRYERGELFKFTDTIACANNTSAAMKLIFNFSEKENAIENWYKTPNIFDIVRRAGYHTAWISNQSALGHQGNIDKIYAERCDENYFSEDPNSDSNELWGREFDSVLLPVIENYISHSQDKNFYCVHLYGSHIEYIERYPAEFTKFTAADETQLGDDEKLPAEAKKVAAAYDNAILYTDYILDEIFKRFEDKNAVIIYISDHGEEVYENGSVMTGHTPEEIGNRSVIEIPMIIWTSDKFREMYPEKITALKNAENNPYRTDLIIHTILDLMDIQTESFDPTKSIINEKFDKFRVRIYNNKPYNRD